MATIEVNQVQLAAAELAVKTAGGCAQKVVYRAMKKTLDGVKTDAKNEVGKILNTKKVGTITKPMKVKAGSMRAMNGKFICSDKPLYLADFKHKPTKPVKRKPAGGVLVTIRKDEPGKRIPGTFVAITGGGYKGVFWRAKQGGKIAARRPVWAPFGPRVTDYLQDKGPILPKVMKLGSERFQKNIKHEVEWELSQLR